MYIVIIVICYFILCFIWALYAVYKTRQFGYLGKLISNQLQSFLTNFILFPYCLYYAIKTKKF